MPLSEWLPRSPKRKPEPATRSFAGIGERCNTSPGVNSDPADIVADQFALAGMKPGTDLDPETLDFFYNGTGAANATRWAVKSSEKAVAGGFHLMAAKAHEIAPDRRVMMVEQIAPALIAECGSLLGRANDVGE